MLENINIEEFLQAGIIEQVICGGESGDNARICNYDWILNTRKQCIIALCFIGKSIKIGNL